MTPAEFFGGWGAQALAVLPWVAAGIAAAIGLYFVVTGIRKGLEWFFVVVGAAGASRGYEGMRGKDRWAADYAYAKSEGMDAKEATDFADTLFENRNDVW